MLEKKYSFYETFLKNPWSYVTGAVLLTILALALVIVTGGIWGVTGPFAMWGGKVLSWLGVSTETLQKIGADASKFAFWKNQPSITNLAIIIGALISTLLAAQFKIKKIKSIKNVIAAIIGGLLMGIGARLAFGCNIGSLFSGFPAFSFHAWVFWILLFAGAFVGSKLLVKFFL